MLQKFPPDPQPLPLSPELITAEYCALREEIIKLTEIQFQLIVITLAAFGTILPLGVQIKSASILLVYPILALFLAMEWVNHAFGIDMLGSYIQNKIEHTVGIDNIGWENTSRRRPATQNSIAFWFSRWRFEAWFSRWHFAAMQLIALGTGIAVAITTHDITAITITLASLSLICTGITIFAFIKIARTHGQGKRLSSLN
jgi:hypothetical protein